MIKKSAEIDIKSNASGSIAELKALKRELKNVAAGSAEFKALYNEIDDLEDKIKSAKNTSSDWVDSLQNSGGPLGALGAGINRVKVATQSFGGALKATGIGLVIALVAGLVAAFQGNENAMKKLQPLLTGIQKIFQGVFRAVEPLFNIVVDLAISALPMVSKAFEVVYSSVVAVFQSLGMLGSAIKKLISGDFSGAWDDAKKSVTGFSKNYDKSVENFQRGTKEMTKTEKEESDKRAETRKAAAEKAAQEQQKNDEAYKVAYEKQLDEIENLLDDSEEKKLARAKERDLEAINSLRGQTDAEIQVLIDGNNRKYAILEQDIENRKNREYAEVLEKNRKEDEDNVIKNAKIAQDLVDKNTIKTTYTDATTIAEIDAQKYKNQLELDEQLRKDQWTLIQAGASEAQMSAIKDSHTKKDIKNSKEAAEAKKLINKKEADAKMQVLDAVGNALNAFSDLAGRNTKAGKALAVAAATINMYKGISEVWAGKGGTGIVWADLAIKIAGTAAVAASGFSNIRNIMAVKVPGQGGDSGGGVGGSGGVALPSAPNVQFQNTPQGQISETIQSSSQERSQEPIKAYVVTNDITTAQELQRNTIESSKF